MQAPPERDAVGRRGRNGNRAQPRDMFVAHLATFAASLNQTHLQPIGSLTEANEHRVVASFSAIICLRQKPRHYDRESFRRAAEAARTDRRFAGRLVPSAWRSAPALEPTEGEQDECYDERTDRVLDGDVIGARLELREKRGKATRRNETVHGGDGKEQDAKKSGDQWQGSVHRPNVREDRKFSVTAPSVRHARPRRGAADAGGPQPACRAFEGLARVLKLL